MTSHTHSDDTSAPVHVVLVPGFWFGSWIWDGVLPALRDAGLVAHAVTLPPASAERDITAEEHVDVVRRALAEAGEADVVLVAHSGGAAIAQRVVDLDPGAVRRVVYVDAGPLLPGAALQPPGSGDIPFPSWEQLEAARTSASGLDEATRSLMRDRAVPHPGAVARAPFTPTDPGRLDVPTTVVCTSLPSPVLQQLAEAGQIPTELPEMSDVRYVDLPTGHWPMLSRPAELGAVLVDEAYRA